MTRTETIETDITIGADDYCVEYLLTRRYSGDGEFAAEADGPVSIRRYSDDGLVPVEWASLNEADRRAFLEELNREAERESFDALDRAADPYLNVIEEY